MKIHPTLKSILWIVVPLLLGGLGFYGLYRDTDWHELQETLRTGVNYPILLFSLLFGLMSNLCRGLRWELLVRPLTAGEAPPRRINAVCTVLGSYTVNMGIPRSGEVWRCVEMERREDIPFAGLFGTLIVDRLTDVTMLGLILLGIILSSTDFFIGYFTSHPELEASLRAFIYSPWSVVLVVVGLLALGGFIWLLRYRRGSRIAQFFLHIWDGMMSIRHMPHRGRFLLLTLLIWIGYFCYFYFALFAFEATRDLPLSVASIAFAMSSMSVIVPVQAGMGAWHAAVIITFTTFGMAVQPAKDFALIVHTAQTLWITLVGLIAIIALPIINRHYTRRRTAPTASVR
ncbi:MAG: flippase-like domain-containing protein [Porphyromonadaceae bacterium]|nr:flippase-like domain-containing protein [Porphyromonadaceae bacterium]